MEQTTNKNDIRNKEHKVEGRKVIYFNGLRWLIRETCKSNEEAEKRLKELCPK